MPEFINTNGIDVDTDFNKHQADFFIMKMDSEIFSKVRFKDDYLQGDRLTEVLDGMKSSYFIRREFSWRRNFTFTNAKLHIKDYTLLEFKLMEWQIQANSWRRNRCLLHNLFLIPDTHVNNITKWQRLQRLAKKAIINKNNLVDLWTSIVRILERAIVY